MVSIIEVFFIFKVIFILEVVFIFRSSSFLRLTSSFRIIGSRCKKDLFLDHIYYLMLSLEIVQVLRHDFMVYERRFYEKAFMNYIEFKFVHGISKILRAGLIECVWFARGGG